MNGQWADWLVVGLVVGAAALWLGLRVRRDMRRRKEAAARQETCNLGCEGCPFSDVCRGKAFPRKG